MCGTPLFGFTRKCGRCEPSGSDQLRKQIAQKDSGLKKNELQSNQRDWLKQRKFDGHDTIKGFLAVTSQLTSPTISKVASIILFSKFVRICKLEYS